MDSNGQVHLLHHGLPGCAFTADAPSTWPPGHSWVDLSSKGSVTCQHCKDYMKQRGLDK